MANLRLISVIGIAAALSCAASGRATAQSASPASADAPVATAKTQTAAPAETAASEIQTFEGGASPTTADDSTEKPKVHGYVEVGVGNRGYREVAGAVTVPVGKDGQDGQVTLAIDDAQGDRGRR